MEAHVPAELKEVFGEEVLDHILVLLTCGDYLMGLKVEVLKFNFFVFVSHNPAEFPSDVCIVSHKQKIAPPVTC